MATFRVYVDWNNDGDFADPREDVTSRALDGRTPVTIRSGRDQVRAGAPTAGGQSAFELNNQSRDYSPENAGSPLAGQVLPGRPVRITGTVGASTYNLATHYLDDFTVLPARESRSVAVECLDGMSRLRGVPISTTMRQGIRTGTAIGVILDAVGWPAALRDIDPGATVMPYWWLANTDAADALNALVASEGTPAMVNIDPDGTFAFRDRHHRHFDAPSVTAQSTWRSSGLIEPVISSPAEYQHGWKEIVNSVSFEVAVRRPDARPSVVFTSDAVTSMTDGEVVEFAIQATSPFVNASLPTAGVDFVIESGAVTVTLSRTSGEATSAFIRAVGGPATIRNMQLRATAVRTVATVVATVEDTASIGKYGRRTLADTRVPVWANQYDAAAIAAVTVGRYAERLPTISVTMTAANPTRAVQQLTRRLSDRVRVVEPHTGLDADCFIEQIAHTVGQGGTEFRTTFGLEKVPGVTANPFTFNVAGKGFNDGQFVISGYDNPSTMFRFDTPGRGFNDGVFSH